MAHRYSLLSSGAYLLAASLAFSSYALGQGLSHDQRSLTTAPRHATLDFATGKVTPGDEKRGVSLVTIWDNSDFSGFYFQPGTDEEWLDWGIITSTSGSDIVGQYSFGYATTALSTAVGGPGASFCVNFYGGALGFCSESGQGLLPDASFCFSGLPGASSSGIAAGWILTVTVTGGFEFELGAGAFGFSLSDLDGESGPLLC